MPARLTPNQKDRLSDLGRRSRRLTPGQPSYSSFAVEAVEGVWILLSDVGGERTLDHCAAKGYAECSVSYGPRGGRIVRYRPTVQGWDWLTRQEEKNAAMRERALDTVASELASLDISAVAKLATFVSATSDPTCRNCGAPDSWHSEDNGQCPDDDGPRYDSVAAYDARETTNEPWTRGRRPSLAPREERDANEESGENVRMALGIVRDATREIFRNAR